MILTVDDPGRLTARLKNELADVERRFNAELLSDLACVNQLADHVERYRGKMLRPTLVLACGMAANPASENSPEPLLVLAAVTEMVHMATLVHDDILDEAQLRRRGSTLNHLYGNEAAVMLGDYLISHAYHLCSSIDDPAVAREVAATTNTVCEGELLQLANRNNWELDERTYFEVIRRKTASLCSLCCRLGARLSGASAEVEQAVGQYGENIGVGFQIVDDLLDLTGDEATVGKSLGRDIAKGKLTLPLIHHLEQSEPGERAELVRVLTEAGEAEASGSVSDLSVLTSKLLNGPAIGYSRDWAGKVIRAARRGLAEVLPESEGRALLDRMAQAVLARER